MSWREHAGRLWREWIRSIVVIVVVVVSFRAAVADWNDVPTGSMKPTILEGDRIVVNKLAYDLKLPFTRIRLLRWADPERGDIVVLFSPEDGTRLVKRVVGIPGDCLAMDHNRLVVNGRRVRYAASDEPPGTAPPGRVVSEEILADGVEHPVMTTPGCAANRSFEPIVLAPGRYFVLGDNRDESLDSRHFGPVDRDAIVGRATAVAASVDPERHFLPRWNRFLVGLR